jgi:hypothetical protein
VAAALLLLVCALVRGPAVAAQGPPQVPATFYGTVTVNGEPAEPGAVVRGFIDGRDCTQTGASPAVSAEGKTQYVIAVVHDSQQAGCGVEGAEVAFRVDGREADQRFTWRSGPQEANLNATGDPITSPTSTGNEADNAGDESGDGLGAVEWAAIALGVVLLAGATTVLAYSARRKWQGKA